MFSLENSENWYVVYTIPRWEKKVAKLLDSKGIECYCPLNKVARNWSDRKKIVMEPLIKGYVFLKVDTQKKWDIKSIPGIINYVHWLGKPAIVRTAEIDTIKMFLQEFENVILIDNEIVEKDNVIIKQGILMDYKGMVLEIMGNNARVLINSLGICLTAIFDKKNLHPIK